MCIFRGRLNFVFPLNSSLALREFLRVARLGTSVPENANLGTFKTSWEQEFLSGNLGTIWELFKSAQKVQN